MPLHDAVGVTYKNGITTENQDSGAWYMGYGSVFGDFTGVIRLDINTPPYQGRKSWYIYYLQFFISQ